MKTIYISGEIGWDITADDIREQIDSESKEKLRLIINSPGGYVSDGFEIYNILKAYKGELEIIIGVMAASVASYIAMAAPLENRKAFKNSSVMLHEASSGTWGRARDLKIISERLEGINNIISDAYADGLGITKEDARLKIAEDFYMTGWEALADNNFISDVIDIEDVEIPQKEEDENDLIFFEMMSSKLEKNPDSNILKAQMYETEDKMKKDMEKSTSDLEKAAAHIKADDIKEAIKNKLAINPVEKPVENNIMGDVNMDLKEFLKSNPDAQAEYKDALTSAKSKGIEEMRSELTADRERLAKILELEGVELSETAINAISGEMTVESYMEEELKKQKNLRKDPEKGNVFGKLLAKQTPGEQDAETAKSVENKVLSDEEFDAESKEMAKLIGGK